MEDKCNELIKTELAYHNLTGAEYELIRFKEGVAVARVKAGEGTLILKAFIDEPSRREIKNYRVLRALGVPTLKICGLSERSILMEDIGASEVLRLGREEDLHDPDVIVSLARWYRLLHERGRAYVSSHGFGMYDEWDMFTPENLEKLSRTLGEECARPLERLKASYPELRARIDGTPKTLCYNDFYYTNMAVAKDKSRALMYDYNLLGKGCYINDIMNVTYWFGDEERALFLSEYGGIDEELIELQKLISPVISLVSAAERGVFPDWAEEAREELIELEI
ncbi:MAG: phosphotransferase [Clostridia bacterium]|nr:phosphotransferase [Clostridia bacterium]